MRIRTLADRLSTTPHIIRFYERRGLLPAPPRAENRYREYAESDVERMRLLIGLRRLDLPLEQAAELASMCAEGRCDEVSIGLAAVVADKRTELRRRMDEMRYLDRRLAHLEGDLSAGEAPRSVIAHGKEELT